MKKNKMMRFASLLLVLTLLSTCAISGTFAKYTTTTSGSDTAKVAKWGVTVAIDGADVLFGDTYAKDDSTVTDQSITNSVATSTENTNVVAPGTKGALTFSILGKPEVAVSVDVTFSGENDNDLSMITLPGGNEKTYTDYTVAPYTGTFTQTQNYYPIQWTLKKSETSPQSWDDVKAVVEGNLQVIEDYFEGTESGLNGNYAPNTDLTNTFGYYQLSWKWDFGTGTNDKQDTYLGNVLAGTLEDSGVVQNETLNFKVTVTQID